MRLRLLFVVLVAVGLAACSASSTSGTAARKHRSSTTVTPPEPTSTSTSPPSIPTTNPALLIGPRAFSVDGVSLPAGAWLTVGLHPTTAPVRVDIAGTVQPLDVCPAGLDGSLTNSSWPSFFKFPSCVPMTDGSAVLPETDGNTHVAFAIKAVSATDPLTFSLGVSYVATDAFVEVIPPRAASTDLSMIFTPLSSTTSVTVSPAGLVTPAPGFAVGISQAGRSVNTPQPCDFPTEADSCTGPVNPGQPTDVHIVGPGSNVVIYPAWK